MYHIDIDINVDLLFALGLSFDRPKKQRKERTDPDPEEKRKYQEEANQFAMSLVEGLGDQDGKLLANRWTQHCWMLHVASVFTPCCMLLHVVRSCCAKFETHQTFEPTTLNIPFVP